MSELRGFEPGDERALAEICVRTAAFGADARGVLGDDSLWGEVFALPYPTHDPRYSFVVADSSGRPQGYVVSTPDTDAFEEFFRDEWWPARRPAESGARSERERALLSYADARGTSRIPWAREYPAHLHIDLLPDLQGQGWGRRLMGAVADALRADGVPAVHLVASAENTRAVCFYEKLGWTRLESTPHDAAFGLRL